MLPKANRLPSQLIHSVLKQGRRFQKGPLSLSIAKSESVAPRFAIIVPLSLEKRSTVRNRIKRQLRDAIRSLLPRIAGPWDVVVRYSGRGSKDSIPIPILVEQAFAVGGIVKTSL